MWLITPIGFFSVVRKPGDIKAGTLTVRARVREDLEQLKTSHLPELGAITESNATDYAFRAQAPKAAVAQAMTRLIDSLDYDNFKNVVAQRQGQARAALYHEVWSVLYGLQSTAQSHQHLHPKLDDRRQPVVIRDPSTASTQKSWKQTDQIAAATPGQKLPATLHSVRFRAWEDAPTTSNGWEALTSKKEIPEPTFKAPKGLAHAAGVVIQERDGRIWMVCPTNQFGGYEATFPKGRLDGKSLQATALCEAFEESGLQVRLIRHLVDVKRTQTYTRYYLAERVGGSPADMGWESQCVLLVPVGALGSLDLSPSDLTVAAKIDA